MRNTIKLTPFALVTASLVAAPGLFAASEAPASDESSGVAVQLQDAPKVPAKRVPTKTAPVQKAPVKKVPPKKTPAKKPKKSAEQAPSKKAPSGNVPARKLPPAKPAPPNKPAAKRTPENNKGTLQKDPGKAKKKKWVKKRPVKKLARWVKKKLSKKHSAMTAFELTMLDNGIAHVRAQGDCGRFPVRKMHFRGYRVDVDQRQRSADYSKEKGPRNFVIDTYVPVFNQQDVELAKKRGLKKLQRELKIAPRCQVYKRKKWGRRKDHPSVSMDLELPVTPDLDPAQFQP